MTTGKAPQPISVPVALGECSYRVMIGPGLLAQAGELIAQAMGEPRAFVVTNPVVQRLHGEALARGLGGMQAEVLLVPAGERAKTLRRAGLLYDRLLALGADRRSAIIAFGGGVIGDLAGFVAATYMRGVPYVQVPTTLLAQVDASVGGKVAVDHSKAKNLIGAFHQPRLVLADTRPLATLPAREYRAGLAEVVKHGVIACPALFAWLEQSVAALARREEGALVHAVARSCEIKADVVQRDEREEGLRAILNYGHTVGHALEVVTGYRAFPHGEAVAIGMVAAARVARGLGMCERRECARLERLLEALDLPTRLPPVPASALLTTMQADKKALGGAPRLVLPRAIGRVEVVSGVGMGALRRVLVALGAQDR